jgi:glycosyltransferase involved in cell wall biosynthesis
MCADQLRVAAFLPQISEHSGGVEQTLRIFEYSDREDIRYTAFLSDDNIRDSSLRARIEGLRRSGVLEVRSLDNGGGHGSRHEFDAMVIPSEFWIHPLNRARAAGIEAPALVKVHQLPYIGTFDVLKAVGVDTPSPSDVVRYPFVSARHLGDGVGYFAFQTTACLLYVRALSRLRGSGIMAVTPVTVKNLRTAGFSRRTYVPEVHVGTDGPLLRESMRRDEAPMYDGIYVGRFHPHKGFLDLPLITAHLKRLLRRDVRVAVCGSPTSSRHLAQFRERAKALGVEGNLAMLGWLPQRDLYAAIRRSRALLYPSYVDAFSITVLESLCLGVPVVAYGIDALQMLWSRRKGVFLSPVGDPQGLARLFAALDSDSRLATARKEAGRQSDDLITTHTWEAAMACERRFYETYFERVGG